MCGSKLTVVRVGLTLAPGNDSEFVWKLTVFLWKLTVFVWKLTVFVCLALDAEKKLTARLTVHEKKVTAAFNCTERNVTKM